MSKKCPNCLEIFDDNYTFCANCGSRLIGNPMDSDNEPSLNIGDGNAISGGVNIDTSKHVTSHDTHYHSTIHERSKSESELQLEASNQLRSKAESIIAERGRLDSVALAQLRPIALQLGIDEETFKSIIKDVRTNRNGGNAGLGAANARYLQQAQQAVQTNDMDALSNLTPRLEAMAAISHDDNVQYLYYLTLSLLYPIKSMEVYERQTDENYWRTFWAIISYVRTGKYAEATKVLALFEPLRFEKSEDDQNLLEAYSNIMMDDKDAAQEFLDEILGEPSEQVKPLLRAIESRLYDEEIDNLETRFYSERILTKSDIALMPSQKSKTQSEESEDKKPIENKSEVNPKAETEDRSASEIYLDACNATGYKKTELLKQAAGKGNPAAMYDLACHYVSENPKLGFEWLLKAADLGYIEAVQYVGQVYESGYFGELEVGKDFDLAEKYYIEGYSDPEEQATFLSGLYYERGRTHERNNYYEKALLWYEKGIQLYDDILCVASAAGIYVETGQYFNAHKAYNYSLRAFNEGVGIAQYVLGYCYTYGIGCVQDTNKGLSLIREAAEQGDERAELWIENNDTIDQQLKMEAIFSNMRILNTINKIDVRGKLNINHAMGMTFDVTVQWNFWDFGKLYTGRELIVDTITSPYELTEWEEFKFGVFNYDQMRPHSSPNKHEGECIIRLHEKESTDIISQITIPCCVEFKLPFFGDPKVQCTDYKFNESNNRL